LTKTINFLILKTMNKIIAFFKRLFGVKEEVQVTPPPTTPKPKPKRKPTPKRKPKTTGTPKSAEIKEDLKKPTPKKRPQKRKPRKSGGSSGNGRQPYNTK
jgi:hypothetical protein